MDRDLYELADSLQFTLSPDGDRFSLCRTADVSKPVAYQNLTADEVKKILETWKLRGLQGG